MKRHKNKIFMAMIVSAMLLPTGCFQTFKENPALRSTGFFYVGWKVASESIEHSRGNIEAVESIEKALGFLLQSDAKAIVYSYVENDWYPDIRDKVNLPEIEKQLLEQLFVFPFWERMKEKYGGDSLKLDDPQVRADIASFARGLKEAVDTYQLP